MTTNTNGAYNRLVFSSNLVILLDFLYFLDALLLLYILLYVVFSALINNLQGFPQQKAYLTFISSFNNINIFTLEFSYQISILCRSQPFVCIRLPGMGDFVASYLHAPGEKRITDYFFISNSVMKSSSFITETISGFPNTGVIT